mmetsp:Transcript_957/g.2687  ORF Transcript_957/g.2687 Transcript_957/m.2687 type:complete len:264 (-) Transcript_957:17-808(-)
MDAVQLLLQVVGGAGQDARHVLQEQDGVDGIVGRAGHPTQISGHQSRLRTEGLLDPGHPPAGLGIGAAQFGRDGRFRYRPHQGKDDEAQEGVEVSPGADRGLDAERSARHVVEREDGQGYETQVLGLRLRLMRQMRQMQLGFAVGPLSVVIDIGIVADAEYSLVVSRRRWGRVQVVAIALLGALPNACRRGRRIAGTCWCRGTAVVRIFGHHFGASNFAGRIAKGSGYGVLSVHHGGGGCASKFGAAAAFARLRSVPHGLQAW